MIRSGEEIYLEVEVGRQPTWRFASLATSIGHSAWDNELDMSRTRDVQRVFDPIKPDLLYESMKQDAARARKFVGVIAVAHDGETMGGVGVAWGINDPVPRDRSKSWPRRMLNRLIHPEKPVATLSQCNVRNVYQNQRIAASLVHTFFGEFDADQTPCIYVRGTEQPDHDWLQQDDVLKWDGTEPAADFMLSRTDGGHAVRQWRYHGTSVGELRAAIDHRYPERPVDRIYDVYRHPEYGGYKVNRADQTVTRF